MQSTDNWNQNSNHTSPRETPLGLFFSDNNPHEQAGKINLQLSTTVLEDSLFLKPANLLEHSADELTAAHIYFPDAITANNDAISWSMDQSQSQTFADFCLEHQDQLEEEVLHSIVLKMCTMLHLIHLHQAADYPISADMIRISDQGEPLIFLLPPLNPQAANHKLKGALFSSQVSAPEVYQANTMNPQAFAFNIGVLAAQLIGFPFQQNFQNEQPEILTQAIIHWLQNTQEQGPLSKLKSVIMASLQMDPATRPYCPMKIYKALTGTAPANCQE